MELKMSTWLNKEELETIKNTLRELGEENLFDEMNEFLECAGGIDTGDSFTGKGKYFGGAYIMNLHGVNKKELIKLSKDYDLLKEYDEP